jgi:hypothetical protein
MKRFCGHAVTKGKMQDLTPFSVRHGGSAKSQYDIQIEVPVKARPKAKAVVW